jgi:hypothetical protein
LIHFLCFPALFLVFNADSSVAAEEAHSCLGARFCAHQHSW